MTKTLPVMSRAWIKMRIDQAKEFAKEKREYENQEALKESFPSEVVEIKSQSDY